MRVLAITVALTLMSGVRALTPEGALSDAPEDERLVRFSDALSSAGIPFRGDLVPLHRDALADTLLSEGASASASARSKYEWPIAGSVERAHLAATKGDFLANEASKTAYWYTQRLDHFSATDTRTFHQRFFVYEPKHVDPQGPVFLYVTGAEAVNGVPEDDVRLIAKHWAAPVVVLEHRYYGESQPFPDLATKNLEWLTTRQALADLANFRDFFQNVYNKLHSFPAHNAHPWMAFGVGRGGALAAFFRLKYPHLVKGAITDSATIRGVTDFSQFDLASGHILGNVCGPAVRDAVNALTALRDSGLDRAHIDAVFPTKGLGEEDFLLMLRDIVTLPIVYGRMHDMCTTVLEERKKGESAIHALAVHFKKNFLPLFAPHGLSDYSIAKVQDTSLPSKKTGYSGARQFLYQQCTEFGQFRTSDKSGKGIIPHRLDAAFYHHRCKEVFGTKLWPDVDQFNRIYGKDHISASHVLFLQNSQDPFRLAGVSHTIRPSEPAMIVKCYNCGHATSFRGCPSGPNVNNLKPGLCQDQQAILNSRKAVMHFVNVFVRQP